MKIYYKNQVRDEKTCEKSLILCYGNPYGKYENGVNEYQGKSNGSYMGIPIAPFKFIKPDLEVELTTDAIGPVRNGESVNISATVYSLHPKVETDYKWIIQGKTTGKYYHINDILHPSYSGHGVESEVEIEIAKALKGDKVTVTTNFDLTFDMPSEPVEISFIINKTGSNPEENKLENNKDTLTIEWEKYNITSSKLSLNYNQLSKEIQYEIGSSSGSVTSPRGTWAGNPTSGISIWTESNDAGLRDIYYANNEINNEGLSVSVDEAEGTTSSIGNYFKLKIICT